MSVCCCLVNRARPFIIKHKHQGSFVFLLLLFFLSPEEDRLEQTRLCRREHRKVRHNCASRLRRCMRAQKPRRVRPKARCAGYRPVADRTGQGARLSPPHCCGPRPRAPAAVATRSSSRAGVPPRARVAATESSGAARHQNGGTGGRSCQRPQEAHAPCITCRASRASHLCGCAPANRGLSSFCPGGNAAGGRDGARRAQAGEREGELAASL